MKTARVITRIAKNLPNNWQKYRVLISNKRNFDVLYSYVTTNKTLLQVGKDFNISADRVRQLIGKTLEQMKLISERRTSEAREDFVLKYCCKDCRYLLTPEAITISRSKIYKCDNCGKDFKYGTE